MSLLFPATTNRTNVDAFGLFTGKVGYAWNNFMVYAKGGAAVQSVDYRYFTTATNVTGGTADETRWGATVGVGLEYAFAPNWSAGVEYNHLFMGNRDVTFAPAPNVDRSRPARHRRVHRPHQLPLRWSGRSRATETCRLILDFRKAGLAPAFFVVCISLLQTAVADHTQATADSF